MGLSQSAALDAVRNIMQSARAAELPRLERIHAAMQPIGPLRKSQVEVPIDAPNVMRRLAEKADTNLLPLVVKTFSQVLKIDGYYTASSPDRSTAWNYFQRNRMNAGQTGIHRSALQYGASYATVLPGSQGPVSKGYSPRQMTAVYSDPTWDEWPMLALDIDGQMLRLFDEEKVYYIGAQNPVRGTFQDDSVLGASANQFHYIESRSHDAGICPVVRWRDRMLLDGEEQFGIVEPLMTVQARINETVFGQLVAQFFAAFKQKYVLGWIPKSEAEELRMGASDIWYFADGKSEGMEVGSLPETDLTRYISAKESAMLDMAAQGQLPAQNLGIPALSNISAETLAALEAGKEREADEIGTSLGESWEQWFRLCSHLDGQAEAAADYTSEVRWKDATARSFAQTVDGLGKLAQMLGLPSEILWEKVPTLTTQDIERAKVIRTREQARQGLAGLGFAAGAARQDPTVQQAVNQRADAG